jgi:hypothetical protein
LLFLELAQVLDAVVEVLLFMAVVPGPRSCPAQVGYGLIDDRAITIAAVFAPVVRIAAPPVRITAIIRIVPIIAVVAAGKPVLRVRADAEEKTPRMPPAPDITAPSVTDCRSSRPRLAPRAVRSTNSRLRDPARAITKFARFAQKMSSTIAYVRWLRFVAASPVVLLSMMLSVRQIGNVFF